MTLGESNAGYTALCLNSTKSPLTKAALDNMFTIKTLYVKNQFKFYLVYCFYKERRICDYLDFHKNAYDRKK